MKKIKEITANANMKDQLARVESEFNERQAALQQEFQNKKSELLKAVVAQLIGKVNEIDQILNSIPDGLRKDIWKNSDLELMLGVIGLGEIAPTDIDVIAPPVKVQRRQRRPNIQLDDNEIIKFIEANEGVTTGEIQKRFELTPVAVSRKLGTLEAVRKIEHRKFGVKKFWSLA